ncbi:thioredoxin-like protein [Clohesyomyces aquaticus]|uniref:thioredoxin-dependent peroxiredoxin n=1 Tax=Clohesyomyces aquaticus TaxID=1231657 RepID=A0A1Y2A1I1_9PLEO|nr:thioredoxin-like protein [Clohesyomyces aquaticus]
MADSTVHSELQNVLDNFSKNAPEQVRNPINRSREEVIASYDSSKSPKPGSKLPSFKLTNALGSEVSSDDIIAQGPVLITFYRGSWCPFCNIALRGLQKVLPEFEVKGVQLVAISPELPDTSLNTVEKNTLRFEVLSDVGNKFARELGIVWSMPEYLRPIFGNFGHDLAQRNGDDSFEVPLPASILVDKEGTIRNVFLDPDYTRRLEPATALQWVEAL